MPLGGLPGKGAEALLFLMRQLAQRPRDLLKLLHRQIWVALIVAVVSKKRAAYSTACMRFSFTLADGIDQRARLFPGACASARECSPNGSCAAGAALARAGG